MAINCNLGVIFMSMCDCILSRSLFNGDLNSELNEVYVPK